MSGLANKPEAAIVLALTALLTIVSIVPPAGALLLAGAVVALAILAWRRGAPAATSLALLFVVCAVLGLAGLGPQQVVFTCGFAIYALAAVAGVGLLTWYTVAKPDLADLVRTFVPDWSLWLLVPGAVLLALINAAVEEAAYRGVVFEALDTALGPSSLTIVLQAAAFGTLHFHSGFPRGAVGVGLTFIYGLAIGALRRKTDGLFGPWIAHVLTDLVIFSIVVALARA